MEKEDTTTQKKNSKAVLVTALLILLLCVIVGIVLLLAKLWGEQEDVTYRDNPELFCEQNSEHVLCGDEEISFWDDPVNYCLKNPDVEDCEKQGETDFCEKNPSSVLCDRDPNNDYDWVDDYVSSVFQSKDDNELNRELKKYISENLRDLAKCINDAGFYIDSFDKYGEIADATLLKETYNVAQLAKLNECGNNFKQDLGNPQIDTQ